MKKGATFHANEIVFNKFFGFKNRGLHYLNEMPYFIHNFEIMADGSLRGRRKLKKVFNLPYAHSPFKIDDYRFLVASTQSGFDVIYLYRIDTNTAEAVANTESPGHRFWYHRLGNKVYISNSFWNGILSLVDYSIREWKLDVSFSFENSSEASEYVLAHAIAFPPVNHLTFYRGRFYGSSRNVLWYTESYVVDYTLPYYNIKFEEEITGVFSTPDLIVVGTKNKTYVGKVDERNVPFFEIYNYGMLENSYVKVDTHTYLWTDGDRFYNFDEEKVVPFKEEFLNFKILGIPFSGKAMKSGFLIGNENDFNFYDDEVKNLFIKNNF